MFDIFLVLFCLLIGACAGFLGGLLGIGGGVIIVPALIFLFTHQNIPEISGMAVVLSAVATSLSTIIFTSAAAAYAQFKAGFIIWSVVRKWTVFLVLGGLASSHIASSMSELVLRLLIGFFLLLVSIVMLSRWSPPSDHVLPGWTLASVVATTSGIISGIAGIGGGNVVVPTLVYFNVPPHRATATASTLGLPIALAGTVGYVFSGWDVNNAHTSMLGYVYWPALLVIVITSVLTAPLGVKVAHKVAQEKLRRYFGFLLIIVSTRMLFSAIIN
ncbi:MAG: sulfite exporter TauE/SafE family protein [Pseudomonadales bacterium]|nr:sulfite exporter TauE/SafE family protein [Pseudomonadales bacterium]